jgi:hypothetical protein
MQLIQIKVRGKTNNHTAIGFYGDGFAPLPEGSLLGLGVRAAHPFFCTFGWLKWASL